jgi:multidrug efflux pump subunit AcrA (membrane-fusion protein)
MNASNNRPVAVAIATLTLLTAAGLGLTLPSRAADDTKKSAPKPALTVTTVQPQTGQLSVRLAANGSIAAWQEAIIGSEANGLRLTEVRVNVGDAVRKGDVLAVMGSDAIRAEIAQVKASLAEAQATAAEAASQRRARPRGANQRRPERPADQPVPDAEQTAAPVSSRPRPSSTAQLLRLPTPRCWHPTAASSRTAAPPWARWWAPAPSCSA